MGLPEIERESKRNVACLEGALKIVRKKIEFQPMGRVGKGIGSEIRLPESIPFFR
jgi:hypothetical protein